MTTRTVHDPFTGKDVQVSARLTDRLRGKYAVGPVMPNGEPEFGWRQHGTPPIQLEAADYIDALEAALREAALQDANAAYNVAYDHGFRAGTATRADRIEALKAALQKIAVAHSIDGANAIARAALASEQDK